MSKTETEPGAPAAPDFAQCEALWKEYRTPEHVIRHCLAVSDTAAAVALYLNAHGETFDIPLLRAAGWLHDLCRTEEEHWEKAADVAAELGYPALSDIIRIHMQYRLDSKKETLTEVDLLCFADRTVKEDRYVGPDLRMEYILNKARAGAADVPAAETRIRASFKEVRALKKRIEAQIGITLEEVFCSE